MVVEVADAFDVQAVVRHAAETGLRVAPQSTGHNAAPLGDLSDAILLRTARMNAVEVDPEARSVRVGRRCDLGRRHGRPGAARAGRPGRVGTRRRRRRLHPRRRATAGSADGMAWPARPSPPSSWSPVTAPSTGSTPTTSPSCSGRSAGAAPTSASSAPSSSTCSPIPEVYAGVLVFPLERAARDPDGVRRVDRRPGRGRDDLHPPDPHPADAGDPGTVAGQRFRDDRRRHRRRRGRGRAGCSRRCAPSDRSWTRSPTMPTSQLGLLHMDPPAPVPAAGDGMSLGRPHARR